MKKPPNILINTSNLHVGGGIQVASSFLHELSRSYKNYDHLSLLISTEVKENTNSINSDLSIFKSCKLIDVHGLNAFQKIFRSEINKYDVVLTLFGPLYRIRPPFINIVGFAQAWIIYPNNECYKALPAVRRTLIRFRFWIQAQYFKLADAIVVELDHVKDGLIRELKIPAERIFVIHNCLSSIYYDRSSWTAIDIPTSQCDIRIGFLGRNYFHKNTAIFPSVSKILKKKYGIDAVFYVTFTQDEWSETTDEFRSSCVNVGPLTVAQCPNFYKSVDAVIFPSLLECFSATPLEAMAMEKPLFVSDRPFNRDVCGPHANYFDPLDPESAALSIAEHWKAGKPNLAAILSAKNHAFNFSNPHERAEKYMSLLKLFSNSEIS